VVAPSACRKARIALFSKTTRDKLHLHNSPELFPPRFLNSQNCTHCLIEYQSSSNVSITRLSPCEVLRLRWVAYLDPSTSLDFGGFIFLNPAYGSCFITITLTKHSVHHVGQKSASVEQSQCCQFTIPCGGRCRFETKAIICHNSA